MSQAPLEAHREEKKLHTVQHAQWCSVLAEGRDLDMDCGG